ncbi:MAG: hypothetical protein M5U28_14170 [Sandaracinaceae bacterium]|nr:hypothetical protein [Sandaracinaceae bacterium]
MHVGVGLRDQQVDRDHPKVTIFETGRVAAIALDEVLAGGGFDPVHYVAVLGIGHRGNDRAHLVECDAGPWAKDVAVPESIVVLDGRYRAHRFGARDFRAATPQPASRILDALDAIDPVGV